MREDRIDQVTCQMLLEAPPAIVPAIFVALFAIGTALGYYLVHAAINARPRPVARGNDAEAAHAAEASLATLSDGADPGATYASIARILREYLDARFSLRTEDMPGPDIERAITRSGYPRATGRLTAHLLERCARAQAAAQTDGQRLADDLRVAREVVALTAPTR